MKPLTILVNTYEGAEQDIQVHNSSNLKHELMEEQGKALGLWLYAKVPSATATKAIEEFNRLCKS